MSTQQKRKTGVIGLGSMGLGMAGTLVREGFPVVAFDLDESRGQMAAEAGAALAADPKQVFSEAEIVVFSLPAAKHVQSVIEASDLLHMNCPRRVIIDTSTSEPGISRALAEALRDKGHGFLDAPVSGGPTGAAAGQLSFMVGGDDAAFSEAQPQLTAMGTKILHVGASGAGNVAKLVNNMLVACHMLTTAEGLRLAEAAGVSAEEALRVINAASGRSMLSEVHFPEWVLSETFSSGFSSGLMRKDVRLALDLAKAVQTDLPMARLAQNLWSEERSGFPDDADFTQLGNPKLGVQTDSEAK
ncbi:NAD(P)-dependent oxidoreductase [Paracoccaceae bacterium GXU_MW_L88]